MDNRLIARFFDDKAYGWDDGKKDQSDMINSILDLMGDIGGKRILDIGCGTGILVPYLLERKVSSIMESDMSHNMLEVNRKKWGSDERISYLEGDSSTLDFPGRFDRVVIYNAFPHISDERKVMENIADHLYEGGMLIIANSRSVKAVNEHHSHVSRDICSLIESSESIAELMRERYRDIVFHDEPYMLIYGTRR